MSKAIRMTKWASMLAMGFMSACNGCQCPGGGSDAGPDGGGSGLITFIDPTSNDTITLADDDDDDLQGIQYDVRVGYSGASGTELTLTSDQVNGSAVAQVQGGQAVFPNFSIAASVTGEQNTLRVSDGDVEEEITVIGRLTDGDDTTICQFDVPDFGQIISVDADPATAGFQVAWEVTCTGEEPINTLVVSAEAGDVVTLTTASGNDGVASGLVTVANNTGTNLLRAELQNSDGDRITSTEIPVNIQAGGQYDCDANIIVPTDNQLFNANAIDVDLVEPGFQIDVQVDTGDADCAGEGLEISVAGVVVSTTIDANGLGAAIVTIPQGESLITARVFGAAGGESFDNITVFLDTMLPTLVITTPTDGQVFDETDDSDGNPLNGITLTMEGTSNDAASGTYMIECTGTGAPYSDSGQITLNNDGTFFFDVENISKPVCTLTVTISDGGNEVSESVDFTVNVPALCSASIVSPTAGAAFDATAPDLDPGTPGLQVNVIVNTGNPASCGGSWTAEIDVNGTPYSGPVDAAGVATIQVTLSEGTNTITATVTDGMVISDVGTNTIMVEVDSVPPMLTITSPADGTLYGQADDIDGDPLNGVELPLTGTLTDATMATYDLVCTGAGSQSGMLPPANGTFMSTLTGIDQGMCSLTVTATDGVNVVVNVSNFNVSVGLPCEATIVSPIDNAILASDSDDSDPFTAGFQTVVAVDTNNASLCAGTTATVGVAGIGTFSNTVTSNGQAFVTVTLPDGTHTFTAEVSDGVRTSTLGSNIVTVTVDQTPPGLNVTTPVDGQFYGPADDQDGNPANGISIALTGTAVGAATGSWNITCTGSVTFTASGSLTLDASGAFSETIADIDSENCDLTVTTTDGTNSITENITFTVSDVGLILDVTGDTDGNGYWVASEDEVPATPADMDATAELTVTFTTGTYTGQIQIIDTADGTVIATYNIPSLVSGQQVSIPIDVPYSDERRYEVRATVDDGTTTTGPAVHPFYVDTQSPIFNLIFPTFNAQYNQDVDADPLTPGYQQAANLEVSGVPNMDIVTLSYAGPGGAMVTDQCIVSLGLCAASAATLVDGAWVLTLSATDAAGNSGTFTQSFVIDATAPSATITVVDDTAAPTDVLNLAEDGGAAGSASSDINVTFDEIEDGQAVELFVNGVSAGTQPVASLAVSFAAVALPQGDVEITIETSDVAGNTQIGNATLDIVVDTVPPVSQIAAPTSNPITVSDDKDPVTTPGMQVDIVVTSDAEDGQTVELFDGATSLGVETLVGGQAVFADLTLADGPHTFTATTVDAAGNPTTTAAYSPVVDSSGPTLTISSPGTGLLYTLPDDASAVAGFQIDFTVTHSDIEAGQPIDIIDANGNVLGSAPADASGTTTVQATIPFVDGEVTPVRAQGSEQSGNTGTSPAITVQVQTGQFSMTITSPALVAGMIEFGNADDLGGGLVRLVVDIAGWGAAPAGKQVELLIDGMVVGASVTSTGDTVTLDFNVADGDTGTIEVTADDNAGKIGTTGVVPYNVDFGFPTVEILSVTTGTGVISSPTAETFNQASDLDPGLPGLQVTLSVDVTECENGELTATEAGVDLAPAQTVSASGATTAIISVTDNTDNTGTWTVTCTDLSSNAASDTITAETDITPPSVAGLTTSVVGNPRRGAIQVSTTSAPGDDGIVGAGVTVYVVASREPITAANVGALVSGPSYPALGGLVGTSAAVTPGGAFSLTSSGLAFDNTWNLAIYAVDDVGNTNFAVTSEAGLVSQEFVYDNIEDDVGAGSNTADLFGFPSHTSGDIDGDGQDDVVISANTEGDNCPFGAGFCHGTISIFAGGPIASLTPTTVLDDSNTGGGAAFVGVEGVIVEDFDGDGFADVIVNAYNTSTFLGNVMIFWGTGAGGMVQPTPTIIDFVALDVFPNMPRAIGDVDGDGINDIGWATLDSSFARNNEYIVMFGDAVRPTNGAIGAASGQRYAIIENNIPQGVASGVFFQASTAVGDMNGDGIDDFVVDGHSDYHQVLGRASWPAPPTTILASTLNNIPCIDSGCGREISSGDLNADGNIDLVSIEPDDIAVYLGDGSGSFGAAPSYIMTYSQPIWFNTQGVVTVMDVNADGYDDVVALYDALGAENTKAGIWYGSDYTLGAGLIAGPTADERTEGEPGTIYDQYLFAPGFSGYVSGCGDLDSDGLDEICIGNENQDNGAGQGDGSLFIRY